MQHFSAPKTQPDASRNSESNSSHDAWIANIVSSGAWRAKGRSLPLLWMLLVCAFSFPMGMWSSLDSVGSANEQIAPEQTNEAVPQDSEQQNNEQVVVSSQESTPAAAEAVAHEANENEVESEVNEAAATSVLPQLPEPPAIEKNSPAPAEVAKSRITVLVSGRTFNNSVPTGIAVRDAIAAIGLTLNPHDRVFPDQGLPVYNGIRIRITRVRTEVKSRTIAVAPEVRYQPTTSLRAGASKTLQSGQSGQVEVSERIWFKDGKVTLRQSMGRKIVREAKDQIIAVGARPYYMPGKIPYHNRYARAYTNASRAGSPRDRIVSHETKSLRRVRSITLTATGYSPDPRENGGYTVTATGLPIGYGAAAVDPRVIPLGTKMYVEGYGYAFACDVGGAIKGKRIDLAYDSYRLANTKGRKKVKVWILAP